MRSRIIVATASGGLLVFWACGLAAAGFTVMAEVSGQETRETTIAGEADRTSVQQVLVAQNQTRNDAKKRANGRNYPCQDFSARRQTCGRATNQEPRWMLGRASRPTG
jgi:hypothetical protein